MCNGRQTDIQNDRQADKDRQLIPTVLPLHNHPPHPGTTYLCCLHLSLKVSLLVSVHRVQYQVDVVDNIGK